MKEFEKWWDEAIQPSERVHDYSSAYTSMEIAWRAALECMRNNNECNGEGYGCMLAAKIDEELENERI